MLQRYSWYWTKIFQATDLTIILITWFGLAQWQAGQGGVTLADNLLPIGLLALGWFLMTRLFALYQSKRLISLREEIKVLTLIVILYTALIDTFSPFYAFATPNMLLFGLLIWLTVGTFHALLRMGLRYLRARGFNQRRVVIYGTGPVGRQMAENLLTRPQVGMILVGFLEEGIATSANTGSNTIPVDGNAIPILGAGADARRLVAEQNIHDVIITLPSNKYDQLKSFILEISDLPLNVRVVPDLFDVIFVQAHSEDVWDIPVIGIRQPCISGLDAFVKRTVDLLVSSIALLIAAPLMALIALLIKFDSGAPILFRQQRIGLNGKPFTIYKFRTMVVDAEKRLDELIQVDALHQPMFKIHNDPRITRIGRILRKTSLDELPQLFNVFLGDMSLVGPRPEEIRIVNMYSYTQRQRLAVKPGLTGPMQVNGRGDLSFEDRLRLELNYIKNYSLYHDIELILQTVPVVLLGKGAH
ncbi:MAG: sugar transferase [Caldilineaceae bacterium]|nr:sugar transferase [Caldilineaceae bacterium]